MRPPRPLMIVTSAGPLLAAGVDARVSTPAEFQERIVNDVARWADVVKTVRITAEGLLPAKTGPTSPTHIRC